MPKVKVKVCFSGLEAIYNVGDLMPVSESEAKGMIEKGLAEAIEPEKAKAELEKPAEIKPEPKKSFKNSKKIKKGAKNE